MLVTYTSADVDTVFTSFVNHNPLVTNQWIQLALLVTPFALTILFTHGSVKGTKRFSNILPALATGLLFALLTVPLLPAEFQRGIHSTEAWHQLSNLQTAVILGGALFSLVFLLLTHRKKKDEEAGPKKKHSKH